jgi:tripartite-type tricarboxylate transporter receptor subunit TctC
VPYQGAAPALSDLMGGQSDFMLPTPQAALPLIKGGKLRALAVTTARRLPILGDVPTVAEAGYPGFEALDWKVLVVNAASPYKTLADLVKAAKAKPGALTMASAATGTVGHLAGELLARRAGYQATHVPYKGAAPALSDLMGGQTDFMLPTPQAALPLIKGGKLRALAVTSAQRLPILGDVPTVAEAGYAGFVALDWKVLVGPAGLPADVTKRLHDAVEAALAKTDTIAKLAAEGSAPMTGTPQQLAQFLKTEHARWGEVVRSAGVKPE